MYSFIATSAIAATLISQVNAGSAVVKNECPSDVHLWSVGDTPGVMQTVPSGGVWSEPYYSKSGGGGISIKITTDDDQYGSVTQFEYTLDGATLWYDISNINGYPFVDSGLTLIPSDDTCRTVVCPAGVELCSDAYNVWNDDQATAACGSAADMTLVLCSGQVGTAVDPEVSDVAAGVAPMTLAAALAVNVPASTSEAPVVVAPAPITSEAPVPTTSETPVVVEPTPTPTPSTSSVEELVETSSTSASVPPPTRVAAVPTTFAQVASSVVVSSASPVVESSAAPVVESSAAPVVESSSVAPVAPAPTTTAAPITTAAPRRHRSSTSEDNNDVVFTTFVTRYFTVWEKRDAAAQPTAAPEAEMGHVHKRAAHRHHFHGHADNE